jgi:hypothetical protein
MGKKPEQTNTYIETVMESLVAAVAIHVPFACFSVVRWAGNCQCGKHQSNGKIELHIECVRVDEAGSNGFSGDLV